MGLYHPQSNFHLNFTYTTDLGFSTTLADILAASSQLVIILGSIVCSYTVDRFGRRALMMISATSMAICQATLTGLVSQPNNKGALNAAVFFLFLYYFVYVLGFLGEFQTSDTFHRRSYSVGHETNNLSIQQESHSSTPPK